MAVLWAVAAWGVAITLFGLADALVLGLLCLAAAGAAGMVSAVLRSAVLQSAAPDGCAGGSAGCSSSWWPGARASATGRAGVGAVLVGLQASSVAGGLTVLGITAGVVALAPGFRRYDAREPAAR